MKTNKIKDEVLKEISGFDDIEIIDAVPKAIDLTLSKVIKLIDERLLFLEKAKLMLNDKGDYLQGYYELKQIEKELEK